MRVKVDCPNCGVRLRLRPERLGRPARCAGCHHVFTPDESDVVRPRSERARAPAPPHSEDPARRSPLLAAESGGIPTLFIGFIALCLTLMVTLLLFGSTHHSGIARLFSHGWVSFLTAYFTIWAASILAVKAHRLLKERAALKFDPLSQDAEEDIRPENVDLLLDHIQHLPRKLHATLLFRRVSRALEFFRSTGSAKGVSDYLALQSELDVAASESSFTMVKVLIWAIPILGFIGTVVGIGVAVNSFAVSVDAASEVDAIRDSLGGVTSGLGTAFETTLVALVMSIILMLPSSWLQKTEDDLVTAVAVYGNEELVWRLRDTRPSFHGDPAAFDEAVRSIAQRYEEALRDVATSAGAAHAEEQRILEKAAASFETTLQRLGQDVQGQMTAAADTFGQSAKALTQVLDAQEEEGRRGMVSMAAMNGLAESLREELPRILTEQISQIAQSVAATTALVEVQQDIHADFEAAASSNSLETLLRTVNDTHVTLVETQESVANHLAQLRGALNGGAKVEDRGWWPFGRRS